MLAPVEMESQTVVSCRVSAGWERTLVCYTEHHFLPLQPGCQCLHMQGLQWEDGLPLRHRARTKHNSFCVTGLIPLLRDRQEEPVAGTPPHSLHCHCAFPFLFDESVQISP